MNCICVLTAEFLHAGNGGTNRMAYLCHPWGESSISRLVDVGRLSRPNPAANLVSVPREATSVSVFRYSYDLLCL